MNKRKEKKKNKDISKKKKKKEINKRKEIKGRYK